MVKGAAWASVAGQPKPLTPAKGCNSHVSFSKNASVRNKGMILRKCIPLVVPTSCHPSVYLIAIKITRVRERDRRWQIFADPKTEVNLCKAQEIFKGYLVLEIWSFIQDF